MPHAPAALTGAAPGALLAWLSIARQPLVDIGGAPALNTLGLRAARLVRASLGLLPRARAAERNGGRRYTSSALALLCRPCAAGSGAARQTGAPGALRTNEECMLQ